MILKIPLPIISSIYPPLLSPFPSVCFSETSKRVQLKHAIFLCGCFHFNMKNHLHV